MAWRPVGGGQRRAVLSCASTCTAVVLRPGHRKHGALGPASLEGGPAWGARWLGRSPPGRLARGLRGGRQRPLISAQAVGRGRPAAKDRPDQPKRCGRARVVRPSAQLAQLNTAVTTSRATGPVLGNGPGGWQLRFAPCRRCRTTERRSSEEPSLTTFGQVGVRAAISHWWLRNEPRRMAELALD